MKIKNLLFGTALLLAGVANGQLLSETFDSEIPDTWTIIDIDGLPSSTTQAAWASWAHNGGTNDASSSSWYDDGAGPTDDWLITPALSIPSVGYGLRYFGRSNEASFLEEYEVLVSTTGLAPEDFVNTLLVIENEPLAGVSHLLSLADFSGETIYIAFHHTSDDESLLHIDNVVVEEGFSNEIELTSITTVTSVSSGAVSITGTVRNNGLNDISSFELDWNDGTAHSETITVTIVPGESYSFTHPTDLIAVGGTNYDLTICATIADDEDVDNDCMGLSISCVTEIVDKYVVGEEKTGTWCGWCPRGAVALEGMESEAKFIGIAVHNGDPMTVTSYDSNIGTYVPGGYPGGGVDRALVGDPSTFSAMHTTRSTFIPPASVGVSYEVVGTSIEVTVTADFVGSLNGDYRLAAVITEDHVTGTASGFAQVNYYSGGDYGVMGGYEALANPVPAADMVYDHVARALGNNEILGTSGSLPTTISAGSTESYTYTIPTGGTWDLENLHFIGMLINGSTGEILNAFKVSAESEVDDSGINENNANFKLSLYPNPTTDVTNLKISLIETSEVSVEVFNAIGEVVYSNAPKTLNGGVYFYTIDVAAFSTGLYTVKTTVNGAIKTTKLAVQ